MSDPVREHAVPRGDDDTKGLRHPGETHRTAPTTAPASGVGPLSRLLGPGASCAEELSPQVGVEPTRELVAEAECPCSSCEGARMSFGRYET